eukprot:scaffold33301_cov199-Amphora_coffeaeformis.AAC.1
MIRERERDKERQGEATNDSKDDDDDDSFTSMMMMILMVHHSSLTIWYSPLSSLVVHSHPHDTYYGMVPYYYDVCSMARAARSTHNLCLSRFAARRARRNI